MPSLRPSVGNPARWAEAVPEVLADRVGLMRHHLFTTEQLPVPIGSVDRRRAMVCCEDDCFAIFMPGPTCPACASERMIPLARWLDRVRVKEEA